ncbi:MAG: helix-turn-helix domain-containing protein [Reichenbachiella sp.]|uniref:helix-turn-helix domain-containing protein n=1 Tax=Reichenbachiella sp. TaxID=2184521 RepID=UPI0029663F51|nr:helix-turn-helix domain-containing protein [Reichenbachiella sp.]MDW3210286.1 helix-turn-helix domain-containing protein [Reichenbachiella sp.]
MEYLTEVITYIDAHAQEIPYPDHLLETQFSVSSKKLYRDFKARLDETPQRYILKRKMEMAYSLKEEDPSLTIKAIRKLLNMTCSVRTFHNNYARYAKNNQANSNADDFDPLWRSQNQLNEILLRFILRHIKFEVKQESLLNQWITYTVENTILQVHPFGFDSSHSFNIWVDPETEALTSNLILEYGIKNGLDGMDCALPAKIDIYFLLFANLHAHLEGHEHYIDITKSIKNYGNYLSACKPFFIDDEVAEMPNEAVEIDQDSDFIKATDPFFQEFKNELLDKYKTEFLKKFNIEMATISELNRDIRNDNYEAVSLTLSKILVDPNNTALTDLLFYLIDHPYLHDQDISEFPGAFLDLKTLKVTKSMHTEQIQKCLLSFKAESDKLYESEEDEDWNSEDFKTLAKEIILKKDH